MSVKLRGNSFQADVTVKGIRYRGTFDTRELAESWISHVKSAHLFGQTVQESGQYVKDNMLKEADNSETRFRTLQLNEAANRTHKRYWQGSASDEKNRFNIKSLEEHFGASCPVHLIDASGIDAYIHKLEEAGNSNGTINRKLATLSKILHFCRDRGHIKSVPPIERKKESQGRIRWLSVEEEKAIYTLFDLWGKHDHRDAFIVLVDTGLRMGELWDLTGKDSDIKMSQVHIWKNKTDQPRTVPLTTRAREIIKARKELYGEGKLFPKTDNYWFRNGWDRARSHLDMMDDENFIPYICRHTCASRLVQKGVPLLVVKEWLGHRAIQTTMRYAHLSPTSLHEAAKVLEAAE